ncbi:class I SAM-dependent methyltransferase [Candidatus Woesearchaeota archaeon]|nr:class I SAM-dependent methyltransferase [Candidatus Woesearchaeota archaeon]
MPHYYSKEQPSELRPFEITINVKNVSFKIISGSGVFSKKKLDKGTEVLLKGMVMEDGWSALDLGCGTGVVGIYVKKIFPKTNITLSDVNQRAVYLTKQNLNKNNVEGKTIISDGFEKIKDSFDAILLNPPQVAGKDVCFKLIEDSFEHLSKNGLLELVARHNKGGQTLSKKMNSVFGNVKDAAKGSGYRIYISQKKN